MASSPDVSVTNRSSGRFPVRASSRQQRVESMVVLRLPRSRTAAVFGLLLLVLPLQAAAQSSLDRIRARGTLVIGTDATYPPFELKVGDRFEGFDIDLGNEIGRELGVRTRWQNIDWAGVFPALKAGRVDLVISDVVITDERKKELAFSRPYFLSGQTIVRRKGDDRIRTSK